MKRLEGRSTRGIVSRVGCGVVVVLASVMSVVLRGSVPIPFGLSAQDDVLFLRSADAIVHGDWLGPYDSLTLSKGPAYPVFIAMMHDLGWQLKVGEQLTYLLAAAVLALAIWSTTRRLATSVAAFVVVALDPVSFDSQGAQLIRDNWQGSLGLLFVSAVFLALHLALTRRRWWSWAGAAILAGASGGVYWLCREEGATILPGIAIIVIGTPLLGPREGTAGAARGVGPIRLRTGTRRRHLRRADRRSSGSQRPALRSVDCDRDDGRVVPGRLRGLDEGRGRLDDALRPHHHGSAPRRLPGQPRRARDRDLSRAARQPVLRPQAPDRREDGVGDPRRGGPCRQVLVRSTGAGLFCPARRGDQRGLRQRGPGLRATPPVVAAVGAASSAGDSHPRLGHHDLLGDHRAGAARPGDTPRGQPGSHPGRRGGARGRSARRRSRSDLTTGAVPRPDLASQRPRRRLRAVARRARGHRPPGRSPGLVADALAAVTPSRPRAGPGCRFRDENPADVADQRGGL